MKNRKMQAVLVIVLLAMMAAICGCNLGGDEPDYMIKFTVDGTNYVYTQAYEDPADVAEGCVDPEDDGTLLVADNSVDGTDYVEISFDGTGTGTYTEVVDSLSFKFWKPGSPLLDDPATDDFELTVTEYGPVGGVISGTFSGEVKDNDTSFTYPLTEGYICVKRKADASIVLK
jgi:hypothetical protein